MTAMIQAALGYAGQGWAVFPLVPGKKTPLVDGGCRAATTDPDIIKGWWSQRPNANIGIATGRGSGIVVLDIDMKNGVDGEASLRALVNGANVLPATREQRTPSGGRHLIYRAPEDREIRCSAGKLGRGLDVRGEGGYIAVPPSVVDGVAYAWTSELEPASAPNWFVQRATAGRVPAGERNATLMSEAGLLRARGVATAEIEQALQTANVARCDPPLDPGEVSGIAQGVERYASSRPFTDLGNAERLVDTYVERLRYCPQAGRWLVWEGTRWRWDEDGAVRRAMRAVVRKMYAAAVAETDPDRRASLAKWAARSEAAARLAAAVTLAADDARVIVDVAELDADPTLLGVKNGVLDLHNGTLLGANPAHLITKQALVAYDADARCPLWESFLRRIFANDEQLIAYIRRAVGYSLTGETSAKSLFFLYGPGGDNGKSTLIETLVSMLGDYALKTRAETFMRPKFINTGATPERVALRGARLVVASELTDRQQFDESFLKDVTGGIDRIAARNLYQGMITFRPEFKLWLYGNHRPQLRADDDAAWRRLHLIPFEVRIPLAEQDPELPVKLMRELPGILNWALGGLAEWRERHLAPPDKVLVAGREYRQAMDDLGQFLDERVLRVATAEVSASALYAAYRTWCEDNGQRPMGASRFSQRLAERGEQRRTSHGRAIWTGLGLRESSNGF